MFHFCFTISCHTRRYFEMAVFYSGRNCKDRGKRRICTTVNFAFTRMWTEYVANESFERAWAACICQAYEIAEISPGEIREKRHTGTRSTEFSTLYCDVSERFVSTPTYGSGRITKIRPFLFMMMDLWERDIRESAYFLFVIKAGSRFTSLFVTYYIIHTCTHFYLYIYYIISFWLFYFLVIHLFYRQFTQLY